MNARPNVVLAVVAGTVVALAVIAGILTATRPAPDIDPTAPDGVVQLYTLALIDGDDAEAVSYLDPSLECADPLPFEFGPMRVSMAIVDTSIDGDEATVVADLSEYSGMLDSWEHRETFELRLIDGAWLITGQPWPVYGCR